MPLRYVHQSQSQTTGVYSICVKTNESIRVISTRRQETHLHLCRPVLESLWPKPTLAQKQSINNHNFHVRKQKQCYLFWPLEGLQESCWSSMVRALEVLERKLMTSKAERSLKINCPVSSQDWRRAVRWTGHAGKRVFIPFYGVISGTTVSTDTGQQHLVGGEWSELPSGLCEQGSGVRAMSRAGSFSSHLETSLHPKEMEDEKSMSLFTQWL